MSGKVATITLNPAIDESIRITDFTLDKVNRVEDINRHPGGKGINVTRFLSDYCDSVTASGFIGSNNRKIFTDYFNRNSIIDDFISISGETRTGLKILDKKNQRVTEINYPGITPEADAIEKLLAKISKLAVENDLIVISGSIPKGVDPDIYGRIIEKINKVGIKVLADTSGPAFKSAVEASPTMIKPNIHELEEYFNKKLRDDSSIVECCSHFFDNGIDLVVVSMGSNGALFIEKAQCIKAIPPVVDVLSTVGAGDAMVAGSVIGLLTGLSLKETAKTATLFSLHAVTHLEMGISDKDFFTKFADKIVIEQIF